MAEIKYGRLYARAYVVSVIPLTQLSIKWEISHKHEFEKQYPSPIAASIFVVHSTSRRGNIVTEYESRSMYAYLYAFQ